MSLSFPPNLQVSQRKHTDTHTHQDTPTQSVSVVTSSLKQCYFNLCKIQDTNDSLQSIKCSSVDENINVIQLHVKERIKMKEYGESVNLSLCGLLSESLLSIPIMQYPHKMQMPSVHSKLLSFPRHLIFRQFF